MEYKCKASSRHVNFRTGSEALVVLFRSITGEDWNDIMHDCMIPTDHEERNQRIRIEQLRPRKARKVIGMEQKNVDTALKAHNQDADTLATDTPHLTDIMEKVKNSSAKAEELLERAIRLITRIEENLEELEAAMNVDTSIKDTPRIKLAPLKKMRDSISEVNKSLTRIKLDIFSTSHRIAEERKRASRHLSRPHNLEELKKRKMDLLEEEEPLKLREKLLRMDLSACRGESSHHGRHSRGRSPTRHRSDQWTEDRSQLIGTQDVAALVWNMVDREQKRSIPVGRVKFLLRLLKHALVPFCRHTQIVAARGTTAGFELDKGGYYCRQAGARLDPTWRERQLGRQAADKIRAVANREELEFIIEEEVAKQTIRTWLENCLRRIRNPQKQKESFIDTGKHSHPGSAGKYT
ncbi:hypothetical protein TELCIR_05854 [Teladorsagia circumcincta]|uniref:Uncharacterized protein n=1 Tax=Teladorsagia circumcincta TaxID=45464 RepID=A0A2G9UPQ7_TELCI|nr:hypothetical protein TELCIR_05854 [Teladorsagia circumcincta]